MLMPLIARLRRSPRDVCKPRRPPNPAEAARTLEYEFNMLGVALEECRKQPPPYGDLALEAFLIHARNLVVSFKDRVIATTSWRLTGAKTQCIWRWQAIGERF